MATVRGSSRRTLRSLTLMALVVCACEPFGATGSVPSAPVADASASGADGAPDAPDAVAPPSGAFCTRAQAEEPFVFCDDFDGLDREVGTGWSGDHVADGSKIEIADSPSGSRALHSVIPHGAASRHARLGREIPVPRGFSELELRFRLFVVATSLQFTRIGTLWIVGNPFFHAHGISLFEENNAILDGDTDGAHPRIFGAAGTWHDVAVTFERESGGAYRSRSIVGPAVVFEGTVDLSLADRFDVYVGAFNTSEDDGGVEVWIDDVVVRVR